MPAHSEKRKYEIMEQCFDCYCRYGLKGTTRAKLEGACGMTAPNIYVYFRSIDELLAEATAHCMAKVEDEFMQLAPADPDDVERVMRGLPYWTAARHGDKYRFMYQLYASPNFREQGRKFFEGVNRRYSEYAEKLERQLQIPKEVILSFIFTLIRASVHYAMFEDEYYMKLQIELIINAYRAAREKYPPSGG